MGGNKEGAGVESLSVNSTPASDTFYTATSVLSPDPHDLTSPMSPLPLDVPRSGNVKNVENSITGACGALGDKNSGIVSEVPIEDVEKLKIPSSKNDSDISSYQQTLPAKSDGPCAHKGLRVNGKDANHLTEDDSQVAGTTSHLGHGPSFGACLLSPIHLLEDSIHSQDFHGIKEKTTSTPLRGDIRSESKTKDPQSVKSRLDAKSISRSCSVGEPSQVTKVLSYGDADHPHTCPGNTDNENHQSFNNNVLPDNGNPECSRDVSHISNEPQYLLEDHITQNGDSPDSDWYPGLSIKEKSELISQEIEVGKAAEVLMRLRQRTDESDISIREQVCYRPQLNNNTGNGRYIVGMSLVFF